MHYDSKITIKKKSNIEFMLGYNNMCIDQKIAA